jgi:hypothetical protein
MESATFLMHTDPLNVNKTKMMVVAMEKSVIFSSSKSARNRRKTMSLRVRQLSRTNQWIRTRTTSEKLALGEVLCCRDKRFGDAI